MAAETALIVGAGFAGAVYGRTLAEAGWTVRVIDRRTHIAGNAYDEVDGNGMRVHRYGPHLFHTNNDAVVEWIRQFGEFVPYEHRVRALLPDGRLVPLPVNAETVEAVLHRDLPDEAAMQAALAEAALPIENPQNAAEHLNSKIGRELTDLFFRPYTKKMWGLDLEEMDASVVKRIPLRTDREDRYFPGDRHQIMPRDGYTAIFRSIFDHPNIRVETGVSYEKGMEDAYTHCFNSMAIDEYFDRSLGELPYRSIRFHNRTVEGEPPAGMNWTVTNYTDTGPFTRETHWDLLPHHRAESTGRRTVTVEEPCDYRDNNEERYYPVKTSDGRYQEKYKEYAALAAKLERMSFIGRCGTYQYLDMDQVINQSLMGVRRFLAERQG
ncbi:UDP-galactopyranose mutase [Pararoseomonas sp. SCSIO 73927]|uniref:UDP-galactopyranose mutase n=1 Tax=Pararoseomonas sp. SCSIO 73927 TaxID=3114537 RepID=UPI0030D5D293